MLLRYSQLRQSSVFLNSHSSRRSSDFSFKVGKGDVIKGWDIGVRGMRRGGTRVLLVPPKAGYGNRDIGGESVWV